MEVHYTNGFLYFCMFETSHNKKITNYIWLLPLGSLQSNEELDINF